MLVEMKNATIEVQVADQRESIVNNDPKLHSTFEVGDVACQGDLIIVCIGRLPKLITPRDNRQLAEGNTRGSRHILERGDLYDGNAQEVAGLIHKATKVAVDPKYVGPVFVAPADPTEHDLSHVEHGHMGFPAGTICAVVFQRSLDSEEREARVRD